MFRREQQVGHLILDDLFQQQGVVQEESLYRNADLGVSLEFSEEEEHEGEQLLDKLVGLKEEALFPKVVIQPGTEQLQQSSIGLEE